MMTKPLVLLAALTLCCCMTTLHAVPRRWCRCLSTIPHPVPLRVIKNIEIIPISGYCRRTEIILTRRNGSKVCVDPMAPWIKMLLSRLQTENVTSSSTTASTTNF